MSLNDPYKGSNEELYNSFHKMGLQTAEILTPKAVETFICIFHTINVCFIGFQYRNSVILGPILLNKVYFLHYYCVLI